MGAVLNGLSLHGGVIAAGGTFFVFSDYMKPAVRIAALMEQPVIYIWTHDAFRVGEDGPTHQPVEHEAQIRLLEKLKNHSGEAALLALRPADGNETTVAWKLALENRRTPTALILSRQSIKDLPAGAEGRYKAALQASRGGYIVQDCEGRPDIIFLASGSEVSTMVDGAVLLEKEGVKIRVVSLPSEGLFRNQDRDYQDSVLPPGVPRLGFTAGLSYTLESITGPTGRVFGLNHFGYSAPASVLDEKFGFTAKNVVREAQGLAEWKYCGLMQHALQCRDADSVWLGFITGIPVRNFRSSDTLALRNSAGMLVCDGDVVPWAIERFIEFEGEYCGSGALGAGYLSVGAAFCRSIGIRTQPAPAGHKCHLKKGF